MRVELFEPVTAASVGLPEVAPVVEESGFVRGGDNSTEVIRRATHFNEIPKAELERRMRTWELSSVRYLGDDEHLDDVMARDNDLRQALKLSWKTVADRLRPVNQIVRHLNLIDGAEVRYRDEDGTRYRAVVSSGMSVRYSPFWDGTGAAGDYLWVNEMTGARKEFSPLTAEMMLSWNFGAGLGADHRFALEDVVAMDDQLLEQVGGVEELRRAVRLVDERYGWHDPGDLDPDEIRSIVAEFVPGADLALPVDFDDASPLQRQWRGVVDYLAGFGEASQFVRAVLDSGLDAEVAAAVWELVWMELADRLNAAGARPLVVREVYERFQKVLELADVWCMQVSGEDLNNLYADKREGKDPAVAAVRAKPDAEGVVRFVMSLAANGHLEYGGTGADGLQTVAELVSTAVDGFESPEGNGMWVLESPTDDEGKPVGRGHAYIVYCVGVDEQGRAKLLKKDRGKVTVFDPTDVAENTNIHVVRKNPDGDSVKKLYEKSPKFDEQGKVINWHELKPVDHPLDAEQREVAQTHRPADTAAGFGNQTEHAGAVGITPPPFDARIPAFNTRILANRALDRRKPDVLSAEELVADLGDAARAAALAAGTARWTDGLSPFDPEVDALIKEYANEIGNADGCSRVAQPTGQISELQKLHEFNRNQLQAKRDHRERNLEERFLQYPREVIRKVLRRERLK